MYGTTIMVSCDLGVTRLFGDCDLGSHGLSKGWAVPEKAHVWNDGPEAVVRLSFKMPNGPCRLTFEGEPFLSSDCLRQDMALFVNGFRVGFWQMREPRIHTLSVVIEPEQFFERNGKAVAQCIWYLPGSVRPADLGLGGDQRQLGFCFRSLTIVEDGESQ